MVWNTLRLMLTRGLSIIRWNNFPRVVDIKQMDNVGATLHTALFLAYLENDEIDTFYIIKKIIFKSFADLILSDINSGTKNYIERLDPEIFSKLYAKAYAYFSQQEMPQFLKDDFLSTLETQEKVLEDRIILAAKKYVWRFEAKTNARVYSEMYEIPLIEMEKEILLLSENLRSLQILLENSDYEKYIAHIYRLSYAMRWNQYKRQVPISVMSHKVIVTYMTYIIWMLGNSAWEKNNILEMCMRAIYHDVPELITGDIITPTKKAVPGFSHLLEKVESEMMNDYFFNFIPKQYVNFLQKYILDPFEGDLGKKVKYADILSALLEAKTESYQSEFFLQKYKQILSEVEKIEHPWVDYIMQQIFYHFDSLQDDILSQ